MSQQVLHDIGIEILNGASWESVLADPRWSDQRIYLHCEQDRLDGQIDIDGIYVSLTECHFAASCSPQQQRPETWKIYTQATILGNQAQNTRVRYLLARHVREALADNPAARPVDLWQRDSSAYLSADGTRIVLFEDGAHFTLSDTERFVTRTDPPLAGLFNQQGQIVIPAQYENIDGFHEDLAAAKVNGHYGVINRSNTWVLEPAYLHLGFFYDGICSAQTETGWGEIDRTGRWVIPPIYADSIYFSNGLAKVALVLDGETKYGLITTANEAIVPIQYSRLLYTGSGWESWEPWEYVLACDDAGMWGAFSMRGELAVGFEHDNESSVRELLQKRKQADDEAEPADAGTTEMDTSDAESPAQKMQLGKRLLGLALLLIGLWLLHSLWFGFGDMYDSARTGREVWGTLAFWAGDLMLVSGGAVLLWRPALLKE